MAASPHPDSNATELLDEHTASVLEAAPALAHENAKATVIDLEGDELAPHNEEEEEDDDSSLSQDDSDGHDDDHPHTGDGAEKDSIEQKLDEEMLPISLNLKNGDWHFRDQLLWAIKLPSDMLGHECQDYIEYNLNDPLIDVFSLRTAEDMDFPVGFDASIARSIRAQLMTLIPIVWKERQALAVQERRNMNAQRRTSSQDAPNGAQSILARLAKGSSLTDEDWTKAIATTPEFPLNAVRKMFAGVGGEVVKEGENATIEADDDVNNIGEDEAATMKKRKKLQEEENTGRRKRKRGTAFEAHVLFDERISIKLNLTIAGVQLQDQFDWDPATPAYWTEIFARRLATELGLPREFELAIASEIRRQVLGYLGASSHQVPPDWAHGHSLSSSSGNLNGFGLTSSTGISASSMDTADSSSAPSLQSSALISSSGAVSRRGGKSEMAGHIPTRSLPILSLHNVIRAPAACASYAPHLSAHADSKIEWEKALQRQAARTQRPSSSSQSASSGSSQSNLASSQGLKPTSSPAPQPNRLR